MFIAIEWIFASSAGIWRLAAGGLGSGVLCAVAAACHRMLPRLCRWSLVTSVILCLCLGLAWCKAVILPNHPPVPLGAVCVVDGTVWAVAPTRMGQSVTLHVTDIQPGTDGKRLRTAFVTKALLTRTDPMVYPGDVVEIQGDFSLPPETSATGIPVRRLLQQQGIHYEVQGQVVSVGRPALSMAGFRAGLPVRLASGAGLLPLDSQVLVSLLFGGATVPADVQQAFLRSGLLHLLAASGANVFLVERMLSLCLYPLCRGVPFRSTVRTATLLVGTWMFVWLCGSAPSILRAGWMATYRQLGEATGRPVHTDQGLLIAMLMMAVWDPTLFIQAGTGLSIVATYAVAVALRLGPTRTRSDSAGRVRRAVRASVDWGTGVVRTTLVVEALTLPLTLHWFGQVSAVSVIANLVAEGLTAITLPLTVLCIVLVLLAPFGGIAVQSATHVVGHAAAEVLHLLLSVSQWLSAWPFAFWTLSSFGWVYMASWYIGLVGLYWAWSKARLWYNALPRVKILYGAMNCQIRNGCCRAIRRTYIHDSDSYG